MTKDQKAKKKGLVSLKKMREIAGVSRRTIYDWIAMGCPFHQSKPQARRYFRVKDVYYWYMGTMWMTLPQLYIAERIEKWLIEQGIPLDGEYHGPKLKVELPEETLRLLDELEKKVCI